MGMLNRLAHFSHRRPQALPPSILVTQDSLQFVRGDQLLQSVRWSDIKKIITYKYDLFTTDDICVGFLAEKDAEMWLEINKDWDGFPVATNRMESLFTSIPKDWFHSVMVPAFERKETVLWESS